MGKVVFHYDNDITIAWNGGFTFNVFSETKYSQHEIECFTDNTVENVLDAQGSADSYYEEKVNEYQLECAMDNADSMGSPQEN
jgi:hypothetical protein